MFAAACPAVAVIAAIASLALYVVRCALCAGRQRCQPCVRDVILGAPRSKFSTTKQNRTAHPRPMTHTLVPPEVDGHFWPQLFWIESKAKHKLPIYVRNHRKHRRRHLLLRLLHDCCIAISTVSLAAEAAETVASAVRFVTGAGAMECACVGACSLLCAAPIVIAVLPVQHVPAVPAEHARCARLAPLWAMRTQPPSLPSAAAPARRHGTARRHNGTAARAARCPLSAPPRRGL